MKVLHIYPKSDNMIAKHVNILLEGMRHSADVRATDSPSDFKTICRQMKPDIVHCHGCWQYAIVNAANAARKNGARIILSPHGQLEPWILEEKSLQEKLHKTLLWQKRSVECTYAVIAFGNMEQKHLRLLKWNQRIEVIRNCIITNSLTPQEMCTQTFAVYQKVMDSNVLEQMDETTKQLLAVILKAGITGDKRWVQEPVVCSQETDWRRLLIYAEHENIRNYVDYGISILGLETPSLDTSKITAYFPDNWQQSVPLKDIIGEYKGDETDYLVRMICQIEKQPLLLHLIELARELRRDTIDDNLLKQALEEKKLLKYASRLMQILQEQTLLEEGYMPLPSADDRGTQQIRKLITNHLTI
ncbi:MAG: glycosyltransferase [Prevotella sp.]|nr:glycosyltransferase [Prevotella sp.]